MSNMFEVPPQQQTLQPDVPEEQEVHLAEYWAVIVKRRRLIGLCVVIALLFGALISLMSPATYKATAVLDVEKEKASAVDIGPSQQAIVAYDPEFLPTQTKLMRSREVTQRAVERLNLAQNEELTAPKRSLFHTATDTPAASKDVIPRIAANIQPQIDVVPIRGTNLVELSFIARSPKLAADVANGLANAYIDWNLESKFQVLGQASQFLTAQIEQLKGEIDQKEQQLQAYGRQKDIVSSDPKANVTTQRIESLNKDYADAVADRVAKEARYHEVQTSRPDSVAELSSGLVSQLRNDQARMEREYAEKLNLFKPEWPAMQQLKAQIDKGRQHLASVVQETVAKARDVARSDYLTAVRREESLVSVLKGQSTEAMAMNTNAVEYNNLKVEVETKRALFDMLLKRNAETQVTSRLRGERLSNIRIVDRALPPNTRFRPSYKLNGMLALFLGGTIGIGLAFLLEYLDRSLRTPEQVERVLKLPALGVIPSTASGSRGGYGYGSGYVKKLKKKNPETGQEEDVPIELLPHHQPRSTIAEAYRAFRTSLLLSRAGGVKTIAITSTLPGEGKTTTALNLAIVLAQLGRRVLLIAADLHKARMHEILRVSNRVGLVSILAENLPPGDAMLKIANIPGLFVMSSGPSSPNPSALLASETMTKLIQFAAANFDHVVIDTPPVGPVADALIIGNLCDGVVLLVKAGKTSREHVARTRDKLQRANVRILGVLINKLEDDIPGYAKYYTYYNKAYGDSGASEKPKRQPATNA